MEFFFLNGLWRFLTNGHLPVKLYSSTPPPPSSDSLPKLKGLGGNPLRLQSIIWKIHPFYPRVPILTLLGPKALKLNNDNNIG